MDEGIAIEDARDLEEIADLLSAQTGHRCNKSPSNLAETKPDSTTFQFLEEPQYESLLDVMGSLCKTVDNYYVVGDIFNDQAPQEVTYTL